MEGNITNAERSQDEINILMNEFIENRNTLGLIYNEFTNNYGPEYYMSELANTLIKSFNTFEQFYSVIDDKLNFAKSLKEVSIDALNLFKMTTSESLGKMSILKKRKLLKKEFPKNSENLNKLLDKIDEINEIITKSCEKFTNNK